MAADSVASGAGARTTLALTATISILRGRASPRIHFELGANNGACAAVDTDLDPDECRAAGLKLAHAVVRRVNLHPQCMITAVVKAVRRAGAVARAQPQVWGDAETFRHVIEEQLVTRCDEVDACGCHIPLALVPAFSPALDAAAWDAYIARTK